MTIKSILFLLAFVFVVTQKASSVEDIDHVLTEHMHHAEAPATKAPIHAPSGAPVPALKKAPTPAPAKSPIPTPNKAPVHAPSNAPVHPPAISPVHSPRKAPAHPPLDHPKIACTSMCIKYCEPSSSSKTCVEACIFVCKKIKCVPGLMACPNWNKEMMGLISEAK